MSQKYLQYLITSMLKPKISRRVHQMVHKWERRKFRKEMDDSCYEEWFAKQQELQEIEDHYFNCEE